MPTPYTADLATAIRQAVASLTSADGQQAYKSYPKLITPRIKAARAETLARVLDFVGGASTWVEGGSTAVLQKAVAMVAQCAEQVLQIPLM